jgi:hypothetical protein
MDMFQKSLAALLIITVLNGCSTDFDLVGQYVDRAVVYGLLDPNDNPSNGGSGHLFRIQKMFLGQASAFDMALVPDSSYFNPDELTVNLVEYGANGAEVRFAMDTTSIDNKDPGNPEDGTFDFFGGRQRLYRSLHNIDRAKEYGLEILKIDLNTQDTVYAAYSRTAIVNVSNFRFENPNTNSPVPQVMDLFNSPSQTFKDYTMRFRTAANAPVYEVWLRFHYREVINGVETPKSIMWLAARLDKLGTGGNASTQVPLSGESIVRRIGEMVPANADAVRIIGIPSTVHPNNTRDMDVMVRMGGQSLADFLEINSTSNTSAVQDKPTYTNIDNGLGLFSSRTSSTYEGVYFSISTLNALESSQYTAGRNFMREP